MSVGSAGNDGVGGDSSNFGGCGEAAAVNVVVVVMIVMTGVIQVAVMVAVVVMTWVTQTMAPTVAADAKGGLKWAMVAVVGLMVVSRAVGMAVVAEVQGRLEWVSLRESLPFFPVTARKNRRCLLFGARCR